MSIISPGIQELTQRDLSVSPVWATGYSWSFGYFVSSSFFYLSAPLFYLFNLLTLDMRKMDREEMGYIIRVLPAD